MIVHLKDNVITILNDCINPICCRLGSHTLEVKCCVICNKKTCTTNLERRSNCSLCFDCEIETKSCGHCLFKLE